MGANRALPGGPVRPSRLCVPAVVALLLLVYIHPSPIRAASTPASIPVSGQVLGPGGVPMAGARVLLVPVQSYAAGSRLVLEGKMDVEPAVSVSTGADGSFLLEAPEAGMWKVVVEARGMVAQEKEIDPLTEETEMPVVKLERAAGLEVRVQGAGGEPVAGARVVVRGDRGLGELPQQGWSAPVRVARTNEKGLAVLPRARSPSPASLSISASSTGARARPPPTGSSPSRSPKAGRRWPFCFSRRTAGSWRPPWHPRSGRKRDRRS